MLTLTKRRSASRRRANSAKSPVELKVRLQQTGLPAQQLADGVKRVMTQLFPEQREEFSGQWTAFLPAPSRSNLPVRRAVPDAWTRFWPIPWPGN
jgi:hypothetical protein